MRDVVSKTKGVLFNVACGTATPRLKCLSGTTEVKSEASTGTSPFFTYTLVIRESLLLLPLGLGIQLASFIVTISILGRKGM